MRSITNRTSPRMLPWVTILLALVLTILPMPSWLLWARPMWVFMILLFWVIEAPECIGVGVAWGVGLFLDLLLGSVLGLHAFVFAIITYLVLKFLSHLRILPLWQQSLMVFVLLMLNLALQFCVLGSLGASPGTWLYWLPALTSVIIWPWISLFFRRSTSRY